ncbi:MAG: cobalamin B12-binding domain-containing protein [Nitrospinae bacterium]|nr:cobalamin B12-binding domain-containing protein [Nitrospinota bacterium]
MDEAKKKELLQKLAQGVTEFDDDMVREAAEEWVASGDDTYDAIFDGLVAGMEEVGRLFSAQEYFVPEMLMAADSLYIGLDIMKPHMIQRYTGVRGTVVIGTVQGDVHDIGKNIVKMMFDVAGFNVFDLGRDVPLEEFLKKQLETNSDIVCLSAMMTTTMMGMPKVIAMIKEKNPNCKILIGGAPITDDVAVKFGADGTARDASNALEEAVKMIVALKNIQKEAMAKAGK